MRSRKGMIVRTGWGILMAAVLAVTSVGSVPARTEAAAKPVVSLQKRTKTTATIKIQKVSKATGYQVFVAQSKSGRYSQAGATRSTSFKLTKLKKNKVYYVKVRSYKTSGMRIVTGQYSKTLRIDKYTVQTEAQKYAAEVLKLVNAQRTKENLPEVSGTDALNKAAETRAKELVTEFSHVRPDGRDFSSALTDADIKSSLVGENIAMGQKTPAEVVNAWMKSAGHRAQILTAEYTKVGVGYYHSEDGKNYYWALILMKDAD